jgi:uncharacterized protein (DUF433 family)
MTQLQAEMCKKEADAIQTGIRKMPTTKSYVRQDGHSVLRVGTTRVMLDSVAAAFHQGHSVDTIVQQYPALSIEEVYGAIAYYLAHKDEVDQYLRRQDEGWTQWRDQADTSVSPVVRRLRSQAAKRETKAQ